jgi:molybdopterin adenylyltransferase
MNAAAAPAITIGIVTSSDRASAGIYEDRSGPAIRDYLREHLDEDWQEAYRCVPDEQSLLETTLRELADNAGCCLVLTTGGTGPAPRDVTPEATMAVCPRLLPGFGELMRAESLRYVPTAILSRQTAGLRGACLIINLPGKPASIRQCLDAVWPAIPYAIELAGGPRLHARPGSTPVFRPKSS